jgi:hypothetical protein
MLSKRHGATGHHGVSRFHHLRSSDPPLNPMECDKVKGMGKSYAIADD